MGKSKSVKNRRSKIKRRQQKIRKRGLGRCSTVTVSNDADLPRILQNSEPRGREDGLLPAECVSPSCSLTCTNSHVYPEPTSSTCDIAEATELSNPESDDTNGESELFWNALDKRSDEFWSKYSIHMKSIDADPHSAVIVGPNNFKLTLECDLLHDPVDHVNYDFMRRIKEREQKLKNTIQHLRDRCENLEEDIIDARAEANSSRDSAKKEIKRIREFWRTKIFEGRTRSGRLVASAAKKQ